MQARIQPLTTVLITLLYAEINIHSIFDIQVLKILSSLKIIYEKTIEIIHNYNY